MIYEAVAPEADIRQGDIFRDLPRVEISLSQLPIVTDDETTEASWQQMLEEGRTEVTAIVGLKPVTAIVITQDCDTLRATHITLCQVHPLAEVIRKTLPDENKPLKWANLLTESNKTNLKWFYLPPDPANGITGRMAVDFQLTISVPRTDLEALRTRRIGRLNHQADEHFRERLSEFFRRYPVDEWYPLNAAEFAEYLKNHEGAQPLSWQTGTGETSAASGDATQ